MLLEIITKGINITTEIAISITDNTAALQSLPVARYADNIGGVVQGTRTIVLLIKPAAVAK